MTIYELRKMNKEGTVFNAKDTFYIEEYAEQHMPLYLEGHIIVDENGGIGIATVSIPISPLRLKRPCPTTSTAPSATPASSRSADA